MSPSSLRWRGSVQSSSTDLKSTPEIKKNTVWNDERVAIQWSEVMRWVVWSQLFYFLLYIDHFYIVLTLDIFEKDEGIKGRPIAGLAGKHKIFGLKYGLHSPVSADGEWVWCKTDIASLLFAAHNFSLYDWVVPGSITYTYISVNPRLLRRIMHVVEIL